MLSRVAEALFWMARNLERAETNARVLQVHLLNLLESGSDDVLIGKDWDEVLEICASMSDYEGRIGVMSSGRIIEYLIFDEQNVNSIISCVVSARTNAKGAREILSQDFWEMLNDYYWYVTGYQPRSHSIREVQQHLNQIILKSLSLQGVIESTMIRGVPYTFIKIGKWLERAEKTARILDVLCEKAEKKMDGIPGQNYYHWLTGLKYLNGYDSFLKTYPPYIYTNDVMAFLINDSRFPKSIHYCVNRLSDAVDHLETDRTSKNYENLQRELQTIRKEITLLENADLENDNPTPFLDAFQNRCIGLGTLFSDAYYFNQWHQNPMLAGGDALAR